jgi:hypothetical protein
MLIYTNWFRCLTVSMTLLIAPARADGAPPPQEFELHFYDGRVASVQLEQEEFPVSQLTLEAWLKPGKLVQDTFILGENILDQHPPNTTLTILFATDQPGHIAFNLVTDGGGAYAASSSPLPIDEWSHVAVTYDGSEVRFFVDGVLEVQAALTGSVEFDEGIFQIGNFSNSLYHGAVRQVRLWKSARTQTQIIDGMDRSLMGSEADLLHYWPLDDGSGQSARNLAVGPDLIIGRTPDPETPFDEPFWRLTDVYFEVEESAFPESEFVLEEQLGNASGSAILDLNADGFPDYFHCGSNFDPALQQPITCRFFLNDGSGRFTDATAELIAGTPPSPIGTYWSLVADFNGDMRDDLFLVNLGVDAGEFLGEPNALILSQSDGTYRDVVDYARARPCTASSPAFPGQHWCGLVEDDTGTIRIYPALEGWTSPPTDFSHFGAVGDIDEDGDIDIYVSNPDTAMPYFLINDGQGQFTVNWEYVPDHYIWFINSEDTSYPTIGNSAVLTVSLADLDSDGHLDLLGRGVGDFWESAPNSAVYWGDGSGNYSKVPWTELPEAGIFRNHVGVSVTKDIDGDSDLDIVSPSTTRNYEGGYLQVLINRGDRTFADESEQRVAGQTGEDETYNIHLIPADINGDGCVDLVSSYEGFGTLYGSLIHLNDCSGSFTPVNNIVIGKPAKPIPLDADQDGDIDFISYRAGGVPGDFTRDWALLRQIRPFIDRATYVIFSDSFE